MPQEKKTSMPASPWLKLAVLHDPLVGAISTPKEVSQMVDEMFVAQAECLPQYAHAIPSAPR
jgi:alpha-galactosidase